MVSYEKRLRLLKLLMKKPLLNTPIQSINSVFSHFRHHKNLVFWMQNIGFNRQVYVSDSFEKIFGGTTKSLYQNPQSWEDYLLPVEKQETVGQVEERNSGKILVDGSYCLLYRANNKENNSLICFKDTSFPILDNTGNPIAVAGISEVVSETLYQELDPGY